MTQQYSARILKAVLVVGCLTIPGCISIRNSTPGEENAQDLEASIHPSLEYADDLHALNESMVESGQQPFSEPQYVPTNELFHSYRFLMCDLFYSNATNILVTVSGLHGAEPAPSDATEVGFASLMLLRVYNVNINLKNKRVTLSRTAERYMSSDEANLFFEFIWRTEIFSLPSEGRGDPDPNAGINLDIMRNYGKYWIFERQTPGRYKLIMRRRSSLGAVSDMGELVLHLAIGKTLSNIDCKRTIPPLP